jgi:hypothetical protein
LNVTARDARIALDRVGDRLWRLAGWGLRDLAQFDSNELALTVKHPPTSDIPPGRYQLISAARTNGSSDVVEADAHLLRLSSPLGQWLIQSAKSQTLLATVSGTADATFDGQSPLLAVAETHTNTPPAINPETKAEVVEFNVSKSERKISMLQDMIGQSGWLRVDKLTLTNDATEEYLLLTAVCDSNQNFDQEIADRLFDVPAHILGQCELTASVSDRLSADSNRLREATIARASENGNKRFKQAQSHVNQWAEDKITAAELQLDTLRRELRAARRQADLAETVSAQQEAQEEIRRLETQRRKARRQIDDVEEEVERERQKLIAQLRERCQQNMKHETLFTIKFAAT